MRRFGPKEEKDTMVATEAEFATVTSLLPLCRMGKGEAQGARGTVQAGSEERIGELSGAVPTLG